MPVRGRDLGATVAVEIDDEAGAEVRTAAEAAGFADVADPHRPQRPGPCGVGTTAMSGDPIGDAVAAVRRGELVVFPTDTVYGIAARPDDPAATARVFEAKQRPSDLTLPVLVASIEDARAVAQLDDRAERLAAALWPGALTIVVPRAPRSRDWDLGGDPASIGVRIPDHRLARAVLDGGPLATTSANRSGEGPATTCEELHEVFGDAVVRVPLRRTTARRARLDRGLPARSRRRRSCAAATSTPR